MVEINKLDKKIVKKLKFYNKSYNSNACSI